MHKRVTLLGGSSLFILLLLFWGWQSLPRWLPKVVGHWLPAGTELRLQNPLHWRHGALQLDGAQFYAGDCPLASIQELRLAYQQGRWQLAAQQLQLDTLCFNQLASTPSTEPATTLAQWQQKLPALDLNIQQLQINPWQDYAGALQIHSSAEGQQVQYQGQRLQISGQIDNKQNLIVERLAFTPPGESQPQVLSGQVTLSQQLDQLPQSGELTAELQLSAWPQPLQLALQWQQQQGVLSLTEKDNNDLQIRVPWQWSAEQFRILQGQWRLPYQGQVLSGGMDLQLDDWQKGLEGSRVSARLNAITTGHQGKGNAVLTLGPGKLSLLNSDLGFQLTGRANFSQISASASIPGQLSGPLLTPTLLLQPGALLRLQGMVNPDLTLQEARFPLAGIALGLQGINGRLQAIIKAQDRYWGSIGLHLDGRASNFLPDHGHWDWRYWGKGDMPPLAGRWDIKGLGNWQDSLITVPQLSAGFDQMRYGLVDVRTPRLQLTEPLLWQRSTEQPSFKAKWQLTAPRISFSQGGYLPPAVGDLSIDGVSPEQFNWRGQLEAAPIGPIRLGGRWDGERLRGLGWWPKQPLSVFQTLLPKSLGLQIRDGELYAQAAFSAAQKQGFEAGGHWAVRQGGFRLQDTEVTGLDAVLPYRLKDQRWTFGAKRPVSLRIKQVKNLFNMENISADLQGSFPFDERNPLTLSHVDMDLLDGHLGLSALRLPQHDAAVLKLDKLDLSMLFTALKPKQFAMSGRVSGELPLYLDNPQWLIKDGTITNNGMLTLRVDKDLADSISANNLASGAAIDWLRYMEINRSQGTVQLSSAGDLTLNSRIYGVNPMKNARRSVVLNYQHQENIFELWRTLRFGDNLQEWLEQKVQPWAGKQDE